MEIFLLCWLLTLKTISSLQQKLITYAIYYQNIRNRRFWMSNWIIHFLISNIFICIFTLVIIGTKKLLKKYLSATTQYHLCFLLFLLLAVPFFPVQIHGSQLFSWLHFFQTDIIITPVIHIRKSMVFKPPENWLLMETEKSFTWFNKIFCVLVDTV